MSAEMRSALVVMRPAGGAGEGQITAATVGAFEPDRAAVERTRGFFAERGFEVGPLVGISFSIAAPPERMERQFSGFERLEGSGRELPLEDLPAEVRDEVAAVTTEAPPDFGPSNP